VSIRTSSYIFRLTYAKIILQSSISLKWNKKLDTATRMTVSILVQLCVYFTLMASITIQSPVPEPHLGADGLEKISLSGPGPLHDNDVYEGVFSASSPVAVHRRQESSSQSSSVVSSVAPTTTSVPTATSGTSTSTSSAPITTKTISGCHVEGTADATLASHLLGSWTTSDVLACQSACQGDTPCISYSFESLDLVDDGGSNCVYYNAWMNNGEGAVIPSDSGIFFSNKYPSDGSDFCYSTSTGW